MADPTKDPKFQQVVQNFLKTRPKPHSEMKVRQGPALAQIEALMPQILSELVFGRTLSAASRES
jgi:hypothetical protein